MTIEINEREALLIVTALGTYQNRVGQHTSWDQCKRMNTVRSRLADAIVISDKEETEKLLRAMSNTKRRIAKGIALGEEICTLRQRLKDETGITNEKVNTPDEE